MSSGGSAGAGTGAAGTFKDNAPTWELLQEMVAAQQAELNVQPSDPVEVKRRRIYISGRVVFIRGPPLPRGTRCHTLPVQRLNTRATPSCARLGDGSWQQSINDRRTVRVMYEPPLRTTRR